MIVRLRFETGPKIRKAGGKNRRIASAAAALLWPGVLTMYVLGFWALGAHFHIAGPFSIATGLFSHWQAWLAASLSLHAATLGLNSYGQNGALRLPQLVSWLSQFGSRTSETD